MIEFNQDQARTCQSTGKIANKGCIHRSATMDDDPLAEQQTHFNVGESRHRFQRLKVDKCTAGSRLNDVFLRLEQFSPWGPN